MLFHLHNINDEEKCYDLYWNQTNQQKATTHFEECVPTHCEAKTMKKQVLNKRRSCFQTGISLFLNSQPFGQSDKTFLASNH
jgi:hypothetical protein